MRIGDRVKVISKPTDCSGSKSNSCKDCYVGATGAIYEMDKIHVYVNQLSKNVGGCTGCSGFKKEHLELCDKPKTNGTLEDVLRDVIAELKRNK